MGRSGNTGSSSLLHLHGGLRPFNGCGQTTEETDILGRVSLTDASSRIMGYMNFACFLPADDGNLPDIDFNRFSELPTNGNTRSTCPPPSLPESYPVFTGTELPEGVRSEHCPPEPGVFGGWAAPRKPEWGPAGDCHSTAAIAGGSAGLKQLGWAPIIGYWSAADAARPRACRVLKGRSLADDRPCTPIRGFCVS